MDLELNLKLEPETKAVGIFGVLGFLVLMMVPPAAALVVGGFVVYKAKQIYERKSQEDEEDGDFGNG